jgi:hypothetical protein
MRAIVVHKRQARSGSLGKNEKLKPIGLEDFDLDQSAVLLRRNVRRVHVRANP